MKKILSFILLTALAFSLASCGSDDVNYYEVYKENNESFFGAETYKELEYTCTEGEKNEIQSVLDTAEDVMLYSGREVSADLDVGALADYYVFSEGNSTRYSEHKIDFLTTKFNEDSGYIWVAYYRQTKDDSGKVIVKVGSRTERILSRWAIEKKDDEWTVTECKDSNKATAID